MAYATTNPPECIAQAIAGPSQWVYVSTDAHTDVDATGYFTNGSDLGMKVNDFVYVNDSDAVSGTMHIVTAVTAGGAATVSVATLA